MAEETNVLMVQWEKHDAKTQKSNNMSVNTDASLRSHSFTSMFFDMK